MITIFKKLMNFLVSIWSLINSLQKKVYKKNLKKFKTKDFVVSVGFNFNISQRTLTLYKTETNDKIFNTRVHAPKLTQLSQHDDVSPSWILFTTVFVQ